MSNEPYRDPAETARSALSMLIVAAFFGIPAFFLVTEHRVHAFGLLTTALPVLAVIMLLMEVRRRWHEREGDSRK